MKILEKFVLILYSLLMLIISITICLILFNIISVDNIKNCIDYVLSDTALVIIALLISVVFILLSIRCLFFRKRKEIKKATANDILLENDSGKLLISKNAIENAVKGIIKQSMELVNNINVTVDIDPANYLSIYIAVLLGSTQNVRDLTVGLQMKIKDQIKENFDLEVKQVNIKIDSDEKTIEKQEKIEQKEKAKLEEKKSENEQANLIEVENKTEN